MKQKQKKPASKRTPAKARPVTVAYLRNSAMHYLSQRAASVAMLRQTLERRAKRRLAVKALEAETKTLIETAIAELVKLGMVDDARFAENRAASLARKGFSKRRIGFGLKLKGIAAETIETAIAPDVDDLVQARLFVERKRLGSFRRGGATPETRDKDLRALSRAGFGYGIAAKALDAPTDE